MKFTDLFVKRPVLALVVNLVVLIAGLQAIRSLSVRQYPKSDIAVIRVGTAYVGASADLVRGFITTPLERVIASADGIDYMESSSAQGISTITVHLRLNYDTNAALTQIQAKVAQVRNQLPPEAEAPVIELETADTQFAAMYLGFSSDELDQNQITDYLTRAFDGLLLPLLGFLFLPWTTIAWAIAQNEFGGTNGIGLLVIAIGVLADIGVLGGGARGRR